MLLAYAAACGGTPSYTPAAALAGEPVGEDAEGALSLEVLLRCSRENKRRRGEAEGAYLERLTHASLDTRGLTSVSVLRACPALRVVYLYENRLRSLQSFPSCEALTHLYLQDNALQSLSGLPALPALEKLYVQGNRLTVLDGLHGCPRLAELHAGGQKSGSSGLALDAQTCISLKDCLRRLSVAGCGLRELAPLAHCRALRHLDARDNAVEDMAHVAAMLDGAEELESLDLRGNVVSRAAQYRDNILLMTAVLAELDGKRVTQQARAFVQRFAAHKSKLRAHGTVQGRAPPPAQAPHFLQ